MGTETKIEWAHDTLNLWWGCTKVSDGCKFCYAETLSNRFDRNNWGPKGIRQEVKSWRTTLAKISRMAKESGQRRRVFVNSMADTFEGPETMGGHGSANWALVSHLQDELLEAISEHEELDFLLLTKRPQNVFGVVHRHDDPNWSTHSGKLPPNVWLGTSVEDQKTADERIPHLLQVPAAVRFLSCEPLIGSVDLAYTCFNGADSFGSMPGIHWAIIGGESGPNARPMKPDWARDLRDQCVAAGVPFFFKQGSQTPEWPRFKDFASFPRDLQLREFPKESTNA